MNRRDKARICIRNWLNCRSIPGRLFEFLEWQQRMVAAGIPKVTLARHEFDKSVVGKQLAMSSAEAVIAANYAEHVKSELQKPQSVRLLIQGANRFPENVEIQATLHGVRFENLEAPDKPIVIRNQRIGRLSFGSVAAPIMVRDCFVGELLHYGTPQGVLSCERTFIGTLNVSNASLGELSMTDCKILAVECRPHGEPNPFQGSVVFKRLWLARDKGVNASQTHQLRNFRAQLNALDNTLAAGIFHAAELALDRKHESRWSRIFSWTYEIFSDYGNSISRPVTWFWIVYGVMLVLALVFDPLQPGADKEAVGWQAELENSRLLRALVYPFLAVFNPLGIAGKTLLLARTSFWAFALTALSLIGTATLALALIGLRRRFKLG